jgi:hypothetical protein
LRRTERRVSEVDETRQDSICIQTYSWYPDTTVSFHPGYVSSSSAHQTEPLTFFYNKDTCVPQASNERQDSLCSRYIMQGIWILAQDRFKKRRAYRHGHKIVSLGSVIQTIQDFRLSSSHSSDVRPAMAMRRSCTTSSR